jgi:hypothetical protein
MKTKIIQIIAVLDGAILTGLMGHVAPLCIGILAAIALELRHEN